jgi:transposase
MEIETEAASTHTTSRMSARNEVVEVVTRGERRRTWSDEQKRLILIEAVQPGAMVTEVARRWGIGTGLIYTWRKQMRDGELDARLAPAAAFAEVSVTPSPGVAAAARPAPSPEVPAVVADRGAGQIEIALPCGADRDRLALRRDGAGRA